MFLLDSFWGYFQVQKPLVFRGGKTSHKTRPRLYTRHRNRRIWKIDAHQVARRPLLGRRHVEPTRCRLRILWNDPSHNCTQKMMILAILCALFGMVNWPFQRLSDLQLGNEKVTLNHLDCMFFLHFEFSKWLGSHHHGRHIRYIILSFMEHCIVEAYFFWGIYIEDMELIPFFWWTSL